ncbi:hypothetical protein G6F40_014461 [Rhizopus arrhizus]|nr:hypothetical protein G6F40_014461 [Rhizopus arrhizus]
MAVPRLGLGHRRAVIGYRVDAGRGGRAMVHQLHHQRVRRRQLQVGLVRAIGAGQGARRAIQGQRAIGLHGLAVMQDDIHMRTPTAAAGVLELQHHLLRALRFGPRRGGDIQRPAPPQRGGFIRCSVRVKKALRRALWGAALRIVPVTRASRPSQ